MMLFSGFYRTGLYGQAIEKLRSLDGSPIEPEMAEMMNGFREE